MGSGGGRRRVSELTGAGSEGVGREGMDGWRDLLHWLIV